MRKYVLSSILGLSIIAGSLASAAPAHATIIWRNFGSSGFASPLYLTTSSTQGGNWFIGALSPLINQNIAFGTSTYPGFVKLVSPYTIASPPGSFNFVSLVAGVSGGNMSNSTPVISWASTTDKNQSWRADYDFPDINGASCWTFYDAASPSNHVFVLSTLGGSMTPGTKTVIYDYLADPYNHPDQFWCKYDHTYDANGHDVLTPIPYP